MFKLTRVLSTFSAILSDSLFALVSLGVFLKRLVMSLQQLTEHNRTAKVIATTDIIRIIFL